MGHVTTVKTVNAIIHKETIEMYSFLTPLTKNDQVLRRCGRENYYSQSYSFYRILTLHNIYSKMDKTVVVMKTWLMKIIMMIKKTNLIIISVCNNTDLEIVYSSHSITNQSKGQSYNLGGLT